MNPIEPRAVRPRPRRLTRLVRALAIAATLGIAAPGVAWADPPQALPPNATAGDNKWHPAFDYDTDGCYSTPAIGRDGTIAPGLNTSGALNGSCRDQSDLDNTNTYVRTKCNNGWCAHLYALYFEKDQTVNGCCGHRHDLEHVVVWVQNDQVRFVSASAHGNFATRPASELLFEGTHPKIVYHKDGASTHAFRFAAGHDDPPENHYRRWQYPALLSWELMSPNIRDGLANANYGSAQLDLKDSRFGDSLNKAKPSGIAFNPYG